MSISQTEYEYLMGLEKTFDSTSILEVGPAPQKWARPISAVETRDKFILNYYRGTFEIKKFSAHKRYHGTIGLLRYCSSIRHKNPIEAGGESFNGAHLHIYTEEYGDKIAVDPTKYGIDPNDDIAEIMSCLLKKCNISNIPAIKNSMF